jgi:hypothetical protein
MPSLKKKPKPKTAPRVPVLTMITPALRDQIDALAERQSRTRSKVLELAALRYVESER